MSAGDDMDMTRAKSNVSDILVANPSITCLVGFYSYNHAADLCRAEGRWRARQDHGRRL